MPNIIAFPTGGWTLQRHLGAKVRQAREDRNMTREDLAREIDVGVRQVERYESGADRMTAGMLFRISCVLDIQAMQLFTATNHETATRLQ